MAANLDSLGLVQSLRRRMVDFAAWDLHLQDTELQRAARAVWESESSGLVGDLWVEGIMPPLRGQSLQSIAEAGGFDTELLTHLLTSRAWGNWPLYEHQERSLQLAGNDRGGAVMITAGTGAGKTESFLLPLVQQLWTTPRRGPGIRALILYPMNALVRDQMDRLDMWLGYQSRLTYFHFTSETPETESVADKLGIPKEFASRIRSRDEARRGVPDICVTNYSMLEYMLARPQDASFFGSGLEVVVLDEAHLYTGTLASEIMFLLRRALLRCGLAAEDVLHLATSATLGGDDVQLREFLSELSSTPLERTHVIRGRPEPSTPLAASGGDPAPQELARIDAELSVGADAEEVLRSLPGETDSRRAAPNALAQQLGSWAATERLRAALHAEPGHPRRLSELAAEVWPEDEPSRLPAAAALLRWSSLAQLAPGMPLLAHRLHLPLRGAAGLGLCLNRSCSGPPEHLRAGSGALQEDRGALCRWCASTVLPLARCEDCGLPVLVARQQDGKLLPESVTTRGTRRSALESRSLLLQFAGDVPGAVEVLPDGSLGGGGVRLRALPSVDPLAPIDVGCLHDAFEPISQGPGLLLSVIAETALAAMPTDQDPERRALLPAGGRRLLVFSDSRREAARLGPALTWAHELQLIRAEILRLISATSGGKATRQFFESEVARLQDRLGDESEPTIRELLDRQFAEAVAQLRAHDLGGRMLEWERALSASGSLSEILSWERSNEHRRDDWTDTAWNDNRKANRQRVRELLAREFVSPSGRSAGASLESLGLAVVDYPGLNESSVPTLGQLPSKIRQRVVEEWSALVGALLDSIRVDGGITSGEPELDEDYSEDHAPIGKWVAFDGAERRDREAFHGATTRHKRNRLLRQLLNDFGATGDQLDEFEPLLARAVFDWLRTVEPQPAWLERHRTEPMFRLQFTELSLRRPEDVLIDTAGLIVGHAVNRRHPQGSGLFAPRSQSELDADPRFQRMRSELLDEPSLRSGLWAEEHTAQLSPEEARRIQELFEGGIRNVLSSSTTMELGVDIGGLSGVLMTNTPPSRARYLQRAGRAGRRGEGASATLLFARNQPFDQAVFGDFGRYLSAPMRPPSVLFDRDRLALRHAYSHVLGSFFRALWEPGQRTGTMGAFRRMGQFTGSPSTTRWRSGVKPRVSDEPAPSPPSSAPTWWVSDGSSLETQFRRYVAHLADRPGNSVSELGSILSGARAAGKLDDWSDFCVGLLRQFDEAIAEWREELNAFLAAWEQADGRPLANFLHFQLEELRNRQVISHLADRQFLPRFGFPLGVLQLRVDDGRTESGHWNLGRSGALALREYAPGAKVLVGGRQITSRGVVKDWVGEDEQALGAQRRMLTCSEGHVYLSTGVVLHEECPYCGAAAGGSGYEVLRVARGFRTAAWDPPRRARGSEIVGAVEVVPPPIEHAMSGDRTDVEIDSVPGVRLTHLEGAQLITLNAGEQGFGFHICYRCGYAGSERTRSAIGAHDLPGPAQYHSPLWMLRQGVSCWKPGTLAPFARNRVLLHDETTDALLLDFRNWGFDLRAEPGAWLAWTAGLPHAVGRILDLDAGDVAALPYPLSGGMGILLYDVAAGGAGHVSELLQGSVIRDVLDALRERLFVDEAHNARCMHGCLSCVLSYEAQRFAGTNLDRRRGVELLDALLTSSKTATPSSSPTMNGDGLRVASVSERLANAAARRQRRSRGRRTE